jgi:hypothetical protein
MQNLMVSFSPNDPMVKIKKIIEVYGGPPIMLVHLIHLWLIN